ncbi:MAG: molybdopterin-dependent oxidoreductase [Nitrospirae bacterium]|nr:molybdopterin-dependent oxidoreductase [Nitrospirota bacterium]
MAKTINLTIDNRAIQVAEGTNLIDAAAAAGVHIPNLCYLKGMKGIGACRLCQVEVEGMKAPLIACTSKAREGMVVRTDTEAVQETRKFVIDLILSMHPLDCMTCTKAGVCNLQKYAYDFELKESTFTRKNFGYPVDSANPFIKRDPDYCVLCGRCVRICKHQGTEVLDFNGRGVGSRVVTAQDKPLQESSCTFCGSCVDVCPVNALLESDRWRKGREWEYEKTASVCVSCGSGCSITVSKKDGSVIKINSGSPDGSIERTICATGRFGFDSLYSEMRVTKPMKRVGSELQETTWEDATKIVADQLKAAGEDAAFISTGAILNEDAAMLKKLADGLKAKNIDSTVSLYSGYDAMKSGGADLEETDLIVLAGIAPDQWKRVLPALDASVRKRVNSGAKLIVINSGEPKIASKASVFLNGDEVKMLMELGQAVISKGTKAPKEMIESLAPVNPSDNAMNAADLFLAAKMPVFLAAPSLYKAAANLALIKGEAVAVPLEANAKGVVAMGMTSSGKKFSDIIASSSKALYVVGEIPVNKRPDTGFLVVQASHLTELATQADVVLPATPALESEGTIIDWLGRIKQVNRACVSSGSAKQNGEIFMNVAEVMGTPLKPVKDADVKKAAKTKAKVAFSAFKKDAGHDVDAEQLMQDTNKMTVNGSRLLWLKELDACSVTA